MSRFPTSEAEIIALCQKIIAGLPGSNFTDSPVSDADLTTSLNAFIAARTEANASEAAARIKVGLKSNKFDILTDQMKTVLRHSENIAKGNPGLLNQIGWGARSPATALKPPEQPRSLEAPQRGDGWIFLDWKEPGGGGAVAYYKIQRRELPNGAWSDAGSAIPSEYTLINQPKAVEMEYRVSSVNSAGESMPSNSVRAVL